MNTFIVGRIGFEPKLTVIEPAPDRRRTDREVLERYAHEVAQIIGGHSFVQEWPDDKQAEFCMFIRDVMRTVA